MNGAGDRKHDGEQPGSPSPGPLLFLVGCRGTGKTTVAALLAERLGWGWIDADAVLEMRAGRSIRQIFAEEGEAVFRGKNPSCSKSSVRLSNRVIATGGGVVLDPRNRERMSAAGIVVWLTADVETLAGRLEQDPSSPSAGRR